MRVCIHRGSEQIGGTCIEVEAQGKRIILELGLPLDQEFDDVALPPVRGLHEHNDSILGLLISHPHLDHFGLLSKIKRDIPILIGPGALKIIQASDFFYPKNLSFNNTILFENEYPITLGPFKITPYLIDHSAYDAYALQIEADGKKLFYSGDFRFHGRKGKLVDKLLRNPPEDIDILLMEGTTIGRNIESGGFPSEVDLEKKFIQLFSESPGLTLAWTSGQNIDRMVTLYKACRKTGKKLIADLYTAHILRSIGNTKIPQPGWKDFNVFVPGNLKKIIKERKLFDFARSFSRSRIYLENIKDEELNNYVMVFRPSMVRDLEQAGCMENASIIFSLWPGYLNEERYAWFRQWLSSYKIPLTRCHTSGHASVRDLKKFAAALSAKILIPIHSEMPDYYSELFDNVQLQKDGEWLEIT